MDPATILDHALFQLTPTRTRCDLVVFAPDGKGEKLASGLLEPFLSHLKAAEEQISKGGYSIKLQLTPGADANASWFTKGTIERFVRFVKTPEILERVVTIEREISQIEDSIRCNELSLSSEQILKPSSTSQTEDNVKGIDADAGKLADSVKSKSESNADESGHGENSKIQLLRVLETRKSVLRKEQGMSYAQASAAGFEIDYIDDLISFSDAFGASRLRDACKNFKELCKRKHDAWLDELATVTTCSQSDLSYMGVPAILLTSQNSLGQNGMPTTLVGDASQKKSEFDGSAASVVSTTNGNHETSNFGQDNMPQRSTQDQPPVMGLNPQPQFLYDVHSSGVPSPFPFPGYIMPGVQMMPPYYPGYSGTTQHQYENPISGLFPEQDYGKHHSPYSTKRKTVNGKGRRSSASNLGSTDEHSGKDYSSSGDEADASLHHETVSKSSSAGKAGSRKTGKKSSRVVVIRNINYVTSRKREESQDGLENDCSSEDDFIGGDYLEQNVEDAVESLKRNHKVIHHNHKKKGDKNTSHDAKTSYDSVNITENVTIGKSNGENHDQTWDTFQNLLLRDDHDESSSINIVDHDASGYPSIPNKQANDAGDEHFMIKKVNATETPESATFLSETKGGAKRLVTDDSFIMAERDVNNITTASNENLESETQYKTVKLNKSAGEELMLSWQTLSNNGQVTVSDYSQEVPMVNYRQTDQFMTMPERFVGNKEDSSGYASALVENQLQAGKTEEKKLIDDSYVVVSTKTTVDEQPDVQWKTHIYVDEAIPIEARPSEHDFGGAGISNKYEPDDLFMMVHRENESELHRESWTPEIDYSVQTPGYGTDKIPSFPEANGPVVTNVSPNPSGETCKKETDKKGAMKDTRSTGPRGYPHNSRPEIGTRKTKPSNRAAIQKAKKDKEEEERNRVEQLLIQRQQRISQRSSTSSNIVSKPNQNNTSKPSKTTVGEQRNNKVLPKPASATSSSKAVRKGYGVAVKV